MLFLCHLSHKSDVVVRNIYIYIYIYIYTRTASYMYVQIYVYISIYLYLYIYMSMYICIIYIYIYICMYICMYVYIYVYIYFLHLYICILQYIIDLKTDTVIYLYYILNQVNMYVFFFIVLFCSKQILTSSHPSLYSTKTLYHLCQPCKILINISFVYF